MDQYTEWLDDKVQKKVDHLVDPTTKKGLAVLAKILK
jgi:hypothetical protein